MSPLTDQDLIERLERLGDDIDSAARDSDLVGVVTDAIASESARRPSRLWAAVAAVLVVMLGIAVLIVPDSRQAVARWFGLDGVEVDVDPTLSLPPVTGVEGGIGPGESRVVDVDGSDILVSAVNGSFDSGLVTKTVGSSDQLQQVTVNGSPGLWVGGDPHEVLYTGTDTGVVVERVAGNTLLWNDGEVLYRVEGFDQVDDALDFARMLPADD